MEDYIRQQMRAGNFRTMDERVAVRTMIGAIIGTIILYRLELRDSPYRKSNIDVMAKEISSLFLHGLKNR